MDDIQSWWEVPSIAHFCSLFRVAFNLLDFDIEELEEALLTDGAELTGSSLLQELIVRLLCGCLGNNGISVFNYQMFLRRLFRTKCRELGRENPFDTDIDFQFLPLRTKVEILHALCDFRLDADDVIDVLKNLDSDSLRVHPLGHDENKSAYWYFYGTRLYREDFPKKRKKKKDHDKQRAKKRRREDDSCSSEEEEEIPRVGMWQVLCYTEDDWQKLAESLADSDCKEEQALYAVLTEDFLPEIPRLFEEKERLQRKRILESQPRRTSSRLEKLKSQRSQQDVNSGGKSRDERYSERERVNREKLENRKRRSERALRRSRSKSESGSSACESNGTQYTGRQTNNSLSSATGKIIIQPPRQKFRTSQLFRRTREDLMTGLYKVLDRLKTHEDAWPFVDPVEEEYAPKYYSVIAKPMDLQTMEDKLDNAEYGSLQQFKTDFQLIVDNCRQYNGSDNEYTQMVNRLQDAFNGLVNRFLEVEHSSDEELMSPQLNRREERIVETPPSSLDRNHSRTTFTDSNSDVDSDSKMQIHKHRPPSSKSNFNNKGEDDDDECEDNEDGEDGKHKNRKNRFRKKTRKKRSKRDIRRRSSSNDNMKSRDTSREQSRERAKVNYKEMETTDESDDFSEESRDEGSAKEDKQQQQKSKKPLRKTVKRTGVIRNAAAIEALELATEQTLKDINKWLDDTPRFSDFSSNSNSPLHITCTEEMASIEGEYRRRLQMDRPMRPRDRFSNELHRRRMFKEQMGLKRRREVQRTIDRLQPGKSKGNLLSKENQQDGQGGETKFSSIDSDDKAPKLSLGKVLENDLLVFGIGDSSRKESEDEYTQEKPVEDETDIKEEKLKVEEEIYKDPLLIDVNKNKQEGEKAEQKKEKPTPNLSAWFKAFGAPKPQNNVKKKTEEEIKPVEIVKPSTKEDDIEEEKERRVCVIQSPARRQRRTSTGSSVSERSSFSQEPFDGNSPRPSLDEPYLSPQPEVKPYYHSPINGTIKVGFYQDTCFPKGSSEKSSSPRDMVGCSPRDFPGTSPRTPCCSPRNAPSPRDFPNASPREYPHSRSPKELHRESPREFSNTSPRDIAPVSPKEIPPSPKSDYPTYTSAPSFQPQNSRFSSLPHYPSHIQYFDTSRPITDQYRNATEKASMPIYPVKKRVYNEIESPQTSKSSTEVSFKGGSFTPTKGAMEQERTFTPTPGRMPTQPMRDPAIPMGLPHHPLQHHLMDAYADERPHISSSFFASDSIYNKTPTSSPAHSIFAQQSVISSNYGREASISQNRSQNESGGQTYNRVLSPYRSTESRTEGPNFPTTPPLEPIKTKIPLTSYQNRDNDSPENPNTSPLNYSNAGNNSSKDNPPTSSSYLNRQSEGSKPNSPVNYNKVTSSELLSGSKVNTPFSYASNNLEDMFPSKVNPAYTRPISQITPGINYNPNSELGKLGVPPLSYSNQPELLAAKINYNHPIADLMQSSSRYNYQMSELIQGKSGVYNQAMQELIQGKTPTYPPNIVPSTLPSYNRPIAEIMQQSKVELQSRETAFSPRTTQPMKLEPPTSKPVTKKGRKKKSDNAPSSGFQQYVAPPTSEVSSLKAASVASGVSGSAFNFGPPLKDSYTSYLEDMRSSYFAQHAAEGATTKAGAPPAPSYFLGHTSTRPPTYPHPFINSQYQHLFQRHSEELLRPMMLHQGLLPPPAGYPAGYLGMHDAINRPSWL